jgi:phosphonopyruvate decarboxylase/sulfopyruvate decarboxylase subunit beta
VLAADTLEADLAWAVETMNRAMQPIALLVPPGVVEVGKAGHGAHVTAGAHEPSAPPRSARAPRTLTPRISRLDAIAAARKGLGREPVIHANGYICRESFAVKDRVENFYMIGSMGMASAIGLGVALAVPDRPTVVFDGDGNLLMSLGILPMIGGGPVMGRQRPANLVHVVFDNALYGSTGNQASPSRAVGLHRIARAAGYERTVAVAGADELAAAVSGALAGGGPHFILARVTADEQPAPRIPYPPEEIRDRFRSCFGSARR